MTFRLITRKYCKTYTGTSYIILVLRSISWSYGTYIVLLNLFLYFRSYPGITELILVLRILFLCEGTRRYDESEQIRIISHRRSDQTSTDTEIIRS